MIYTIFLLWSLFGLSICTYSWLKGEDTVADPKSFGVFLVLAMIEGMMLVTTLIPPSAGLFAGCLLGFWLFRHLLAAKAIINGKVCKNKSLGYGILINAIFVGLVTISYFGG